MMTVVRKGTAKSKRRDRNGLPYPSKQSSPEQALPEEQSTPSTEEFRCKIARCITQRFATYWQGAALSK